MMGRLYKATMYRMIMSKGCRVLTVLTYAAAVLYYVLAWKMAKGEIDVSRAGSITGLGDAMIIWLFGALMVGTLAGSDFENKTIYGSMCYGRGKIIVNYVLVLVTWLAILLLPYTVGSICLIASGADMNRAVGTCISIYMGNVLSYPESGSVGKLLLSYVAYFLVYAGQISICLPVAMKCRKNVVVTAFGFLFGMTTALLATLAQSVNLLGKLYQWTPYDYGIAKIGVDASYGNMIQGMAVSIFFTGICTFIAYLLFRKADVK